MFPGPRVCSTSEKKSSSKNKRLTLFLKKSHYIFFHRKIHDGSRCLRTWVLLSYKSLSVTKNLESAPQLLVNE